MKKIISLLLALSLVFSLAACSSGTSEDSQSSGDLSEPIENASQESTFEEGVYTGSAEGHNGPVTVEVTVDKDSIKSIVLKDSLETSGIGNVAFDRISKNILEGQTLKVDAASGATISSFAMISAIKDALSQAGADINALSAKDYEFAKAEDKTIDTDIVVVGSGAAGVTAAIEAAEGGAKVALLEKLSVTGGSTRTSSGMVVVGGSKLQEEAGIDDSVEALKEYWIERGQGNIDEEMVIYAAEHANDALDFLIDSGINYSSQGIVFSGTAEVPRAHIPPTYGVEFMDMLIERAEKAGVEIYTETKAEELIQDESGNIVGVKAVENGAEITVNAKAVIIASGGFDHNEELKAKYSPDAVGAWAVSTPQNNGDGLLMGMDVGADTVFKGGVIGWKVVSPAYGHTTNVGRPIYGFPDLIVDSEGDRFADESVDYPFLFKEMVANGSEKFYFIFDSNAEETEQLEATTETLQSLEAAVEAGVAFKADTIEELESISGLTNLEEAVNGYNNAIANGSDEEFGRDVSTMKEIKEGPFYALQSQKATLGSFGGLKVNLASEVLDTSGNPIPGLYAAGEVANGDFFNDTYPASGSSISMCVIFGREAGKSAVEYIK